MSFPFPTIASLLSLDSVLSCSLNTTNFPSKQVSSIRLPSGSWWCYWSIISHKTSNCQRPEFCGGSHVIGKVLRETRALPKIYRGIGEGRLFFLSLKPVLLHHDRWRLIRIRMRFCAKVIVIAPDMAKAYHDRACCAVLLQLQVPKRSTSSPQMFYFLLCNR